VTNGRSSHDVCTSTIKIAVSCSATLLADLQNCSSSFGTRIFGGVCTFHQCFLVSPTLQMLPDTPDTKGNRHALITFALYPMQEFTKHINIHGNKHPICP
jgi:hypothetical protein